MAHEKNHDYHILTPSIWPFFGALSAMTMLVGAVFAAHHLGRGNDPVTLGGISLSPWMFILGLLMVLYTMYMWWAECIKDAYAGDHTPVVVIGLRYGVIMFIMSEVMFFAAWFWSFNTLILLCSGCFATWAHHALAHDNDRKGLVWGLVGSIALGVLFTIFQVYEYGHAAFSFRDNVYGANFFMATGFHGFHVVVGTIFLAVCLARALKGHFTQERHVGFEAAAWYWHFVDVVWLFLFAAVYIWGG